MENRKLVVKGQEKADWDGFKCFKAAMEANPSAEWTSAWAYHKSSISQMKFMMPASEQVSGLHCRLAKVVIFHYGQALLTSLACVYKRPRTKVCFAAGL